MDKQIIADALNQVVTDAARVRSSSVNIEDELAETLIDELTRCVDRLASLVAMLADVDTDGESYWVEDHEQEHPLETVTNWVKTGKK